MVVENLFKKAQMISPVKGIEKELLSVGLVYPPNELEEFWAWVSMPIDRFVFSSEHTVYDNKVALFKTTNESLPLYNIGKRYGSGLTMTIKALAKGVLPRSVLAQTFSNDEFLKLVFENKAFDEVTFSKLVSKSNIHAYDYEQAVYDIFDRQYPDNKIKFEFDYSFMLDFVKDEIINVLIARMAGDVNVGLLDNLPSKVLNLLSDNFDWDNNEFANVMFTTNDDVYNAVETKLLDGKGVSSIKTSDINEIANKAKENFFSSLEEINMQEHKEQVDVREDCNELIGRLTAVLYCYLSKDNGRMLFEDVLYDMGISFTSVIKAFNIFYKEQGIEIAKLNDDFVIIVYKD